jgi:uncharacterized membrane protein
MKTTTNKSRVPATKKVFAALFLAVALVFTGVSIDLHSIGADSAHARGKSSKPSHSPSKSSKKSTPSGGKKSDNGYAKANLAGN